jgi:hypothetical protein
VAETGVALWNTPALPIVVFTFQSLARRNKQFTLSPGGAIWRKVPFGHIASDRDGCVHTGRFLFLFPETEAHSVA